MTSEFELIKTIKRVLKSSIIGDDTAPVRVNGRTLVVTNDILLEGRHFLDFFPLDDLGWKAISVNVSDIVASGGRPVFALTSLLLPKNNLRFINKIYASVKKAADFYRCPVIGGNITSSDKLGIDVFMVGKVKTFVSRRKAKPGDALFLTGSVGDSKAGLELLMMKKLRHERFEQTLISRHLKPVIDTGAAGYLARNASASIDISDGLSSDAWRLSEASGVKIEIDSKKIPLSAELIKFCSKYRRDPVFYALSGGEDYKILFAEKPGNGVPYSGQILVGGVSRGRGIFLDGKKIVPSGFDHFGS